MGCYYWIPARLKEFEGNRILEADICNIYYGAGKKWRDIGAATLKLSIIGPTSAACNGDIQSNLVIPECQIPDLWLFRTEIATLHFFVWLYRNLSL